MNFRSYFLLFVISLGLSLSTWAFTVPALTGPVVDQIGLLTPNTQSQISQVLQSVHRSKGPQVQVLIVSSLQGLSIEEAAIKIFDQWKLGGEKEDNGVLFLISPNDKKLRIEVGRGLEGDIPDVIAKRIISDVVVPYFKQGQFNAGVTQGVQSILYYSKVQGDHGAITSVPEDSHQPSKKTGTSKWVIFLVIGFWILLFMFNPSLALALLFSGRGGRGGGGGGGWSGGGGSSGGGGASGDW